MPVSLITCHDPKAFCRATPSQATLPPQGQQNPTALPAACPQPPAHPRNSPWLAPSTGAGGAAPAKPSVSSVSFFTWGYLQPHVKLSAVSGRGISLPPHPRPRGGEEATCSCSKAHQRTESQMQPSCGVLPAPGGWREAGSCPALGSAGLRWPHPAPGTASSPCTAPSSSEGEPHLSAGFKSYLAMKLNSNYCISHISDFYRANINC